jgi:predicted O-methyltransferase YrrM
MIQDERISSFIQSLNVEEREIIHIIEKEARQAEVPIIRSEMKNFLKVLLTMQKPMKILEVGTAVGFSAIFMNEYQPEGGTITTIEKFEPRIPVARENFIRAGVEDRVQLLEGDAMEILPQLEDTYDMIFMDAAKGQYLAFLPEILRLLAPGGILLSDNILQDGDVLKSRYGIIRRNRTIHSRMRDYLFALTHHEQLVTSVIPIGDGVALSVKQERASSGDRDERY